MFDPYDKWLGIPTNRRPITYYQLLDVSPNEKGAEAIEEAAEARAALVHPHQDGQHAPTCTRLLKEIEQARATLLNPDKRKEYDARLRKSAGPKAAERAAEETDEAAAAPVPDKLPGRVKDGKKGAATKPRRRKATGDEKKEKGKKPWWLWPAVAGAAVLVLLLAGAAAAFFLAPPAKRPEPPPVAAAPAPPAPPPKEKEPAPAPTVVPEPPPPPPPPPPPAPVASPPDVVGCLHPQPKDIATVVKLPPPDEAAQARAEQALKELYKADYARTKPEDQLALAGKFLQPGREDRTNPATWFVLLREARDLALKADRPRLAVEAVGEIDRWFVIDPLRMKIDSLTTLSQSNNEAAAAAVNQTALNLLPQAYDAENYDVARRLIDLAEAAGKKVKTTKKPADTAAEKKAEVEEYTKDLEAFKQAQAKLQQAPDDPAANLTAGQYLCFFQAKWDEGLPLLAKAGDRRLKSLSEQDLAKPTDLAGRLALADGWWEQADLRKTRRQLNIYKRAKVWYERAGAVAAGPDRTKAVDRVQQVQAKEDARILRLLPGSYYGRGPENRILLLREGGGTMRSEDAVERGLEWLAKHQAASGMWGTDAFSSIKGCNCGEPGKKHDVGGTAFGLLPFLGAGETHLKGRHVSTVERGLAYLLAQQKPEGNFSDSAYENALASIAVIELYGLTRDGRLLSPAQAAVNFIVKAQDTGGSWGYSPATKGDTSVSGWQFTALKAAVYGGLTVPPETFNRLGGFLDTVADPEGRGYGYNKPDVGPSTSAAGLLCREFLGWGPGHPGLAKGVEYLMRPENAPTKDKFSIYYIFYATQVVHHLGGPCWEDWNGKVRDLLIETQDQGEDPLHAHQKGSWSPRGDQYGPEGGRLMYTSLALITLETYYYHIPLYGYGPAVLLD